MSSSDPYSRFDYRQMIAWPARIEREAPLLDAIFDTAPLRRLLDLGSGTGEHTRFLASHGFEVVGIDASEAMIEKSRETPLPPGVSFIEGDLAELASLTEGSFGGAICLGNTLPHLSKEGALDSLAAGLRARLAAGAPLLLQLLNYDRIFMSGERYLPLNFRDDPESGEIVFLRLMSPQPDGGVLFFPSTLRLRPDAEVPLEVVSSRRVALRGWRLGELTEIFGSSGFLLEEAWGGFDRKPFEAESSRDLLLLLRRSEELR